MKVALISPYSWRPHIEHLIYLSRLLKSSGHQCIFLKCGGDTKQCYNKLNHEKIPSFLECAACNVGSFNAFTGDESIETLKKQRDALFDGVNTLKAENKKKYTQRYGYIFAEANLNSRKSIVNNIINTLNDPFYGQYFT